MAELQVSTDGAAIWRFFAKGESGGIPLMRAPAATAVRVAAQSACFPLVPFGNRVGGNRFAYEGVTYALAPNMDWDEHYLHGDGWTTEWRVAERAHSRARMVMRHDDAGTPYSYEAAQSFALDGSTLTLSLEVVNWGAKALPFGLGWHPYFPLTASTTLRAPASALWLEGADWLPTERAPIPADLDFTSARELPRRWVNHGFEGWNGACEIAWPDRRARLKLEADGLWALFLVRLGPEIRSRIQLRVLCFRADEPQRQRPQFAGWRRSAPAGPGRIAERNHSPYRGARFSEAVGRFGARGWLARTCA